MFESQQKSYNFQGPTEFKGIIKKRPSL
jgi:hypothetical protein